MNLLLKTFHYMKIQQNTFMMDTKQIKFLFQISIIGEVEALIMTFSFLLVLEKM